MEIDNLDYKLFYDKGLKFYKQGKLFEARSYLRRAYLIWPWNKKIKDIITEIEKKLFSENNNEVIEFNQEDKHA